MALTLNTKTYSWSGIINAISTWMERSGGVAASFSPVTGSVRLTDKARIQWKMKMPVVAAEATSCACPGDVVREADVDISIRIDNGFTVAERTDFGLRLKDLVATAKFQASITNLETPTDT